MQKGIDWVTFGENLRKEYGDMAMNEEQIKKMRAEANEKKKRLEFEKEQYETGVREQARRDAEAFHKIQHPELYGVPPAVQTAQTVAETERTTAQTGLIGAETETEKTKPAYYEALAGSAAALGKQRETGGADTKLSLATIETQITQTLKQMNPESADVAGELMKARTLEELNVLYENLKSSVPSERFGMESSDPLYFDRLYDLLVRRFQYTTKSAGETVKPTVGGGADTTGTRLTPDQTKQIDRVLGF